MVSWARSQVTILAGIFFFFLFFLMAVWWSSIQILVFLKAAFRMLIDLWTRSLVQRPSALYSLVNWAQLAEEWDSQLVPRQHWEMWRKWDSFISHLETASAVSHLPSLWGLPQPQHRLLSLLVFRGGDGLPGSHWSASLSRCNLVTWAEPVWAASSGWIRSCLIGKAVPLNQGSFGSVDFFDCHSPVVI